MFGLGPTELFLGLIVVLLLFGAKRIPEIAGSMGKGIREFKKNINDAGNTLREGVNDRPADRLSSPPPAEAPPAEIRAREPKRLI